ncbi:MAG: LCP family protein [Clostridia bacterium]|nr:LCP family protein [Clostridia bacterium]
MKAFLLKIGSRLKSLYWKEGRLRRLSAVLTVLALVLAVGITAVVLILQKQYIKPYEESYVEIEKTPEALGITKMEVPEGITSIALFGIDSREEDFEGLSDSIMIITVDAEHNSIKLVSVMRDSLVYIDGHGYQKINAAYELGGALLAIKTLNQTFDLTITDYATVDFMSMASIIEAVGGIEADLSEEEVKYANKMIFEMAWSRGARQDYIQEAGPQTLNGVQAVAYARIRMAATSDGENNDYGRTQRQRYVMGQLFQKALALDVSKYPMLIRTLLPCMETSLDYGDVFNLAGILLSENLTFQDARIPVDGSVINDDLRVKNIGSCVYYDLDYAADLLNAFIYEDIPFEEYIEENGSRRNRWFKGRLEEEKEEDPETEAEEEVEAEEGGVTENRTSESADESEKGKGEENFSNEPAK